jgi:heptosyltransferase III
MRLLFIKLKHIGDLLLLTPTLAAVKAALPGAEVTVLARRGTESILAGCPHVDHLLTGPAPETDRRGPGQLSQSLRLVRGLRAARFDHVFELGDNDRGRWLSVLSGARERTTMGWNPRLGPIWRAMFQHLPNYDWWNAHRVEKDFHTVSGVLEIGSNPGPLVFDRARWETPPLPPGGPYAVLHPATRWRHKEWPADRWMEVGRHLAQRGLQAIVSSGPDAAEVAVANAIAEGIGGGAASTGGKLSWPQLAGLIGHAKIFAGVDTAAMHLAAACQTPTIGVFGPSIDWQWSPWKCPHRVCAPPAPPAGLEAKRRMQLAEQRDIREVATASVVRACEELLS